jgi:hypothetical protein
MDWDKHRRRKAAAKCHMRINFQSFLPNFVLIKTAQDADRKRAREVAAGVEAGEIVIFDRASVSAWVKGLLRFSLIATIVAASL